jgi:hypothetical protein
MRLTTSQKGYKLDVGTVQAYADGFAHALVADDQDLIADAPDKEPKPAVNDLVASYLIEELEANIPAILGVLSYPIDTAEVLCVNVNPMDSREFISLTRLSGPHAELLLRAVWIESWHQLLMRAAQIVDVSMTDPPTPTKVRARGSNPNGVTDA